MAIAKITLIGMMDYQALTNDDLFQFLKIPAGLDKQTLVGSIVMKGGEFPCCGRILTSSSA